MKTGARNSSGQGALTFEIVPFAAGRMTVDGIRHHFTGQEEQTGLAAPGTRTATLSLPYTDFGARHYSLTLSRWLVPDPLSEKYYDVSPYAYCANDPVNLVDPDGMDFRRKRVGNIMIISAHFTTNDYNSYLSAKQGASFWNRRIDDKYTDGSGRTYSIKYNITVSQRINNRDKYIENSYAIDDITVNKLSLDSEEPAVGITANHKQVYVKEGYAQKLKNGRSSSTPAHEIGHALGMDHTNKGIMSERQDTNRTDEVTQENINQMMSSIGEGGNSIGKEDKTGFFNKIINLISDALYQLHKE